MSTLDTLAPFISAPWRDRHGQALSVRPLPGLRSEVLQELKFSSAGWMSPAYRELLGSCSGLAGTALGHIDFTGCWYPAEECPVFYPSLTLAVDDDGRRWITEVSEEGLPTRVWCLFSAPAVAVYVSDDLPSFIATLRQRTCNGQLFSWLQDLDAQAHAVWLHRRVLARRPYQAGESDPELADWLKTLPADAFVYDLRKPMAARGWPYGLAGPASRLFRCARLPVFAVAGPFSDGSRARDPQAFLVPRVGSQLDRNIVPLPTRRHAWRHLSRRPPIEHHRELCLCA